MLKLTVFIVSLVILDGILAAPLSKLGKLIQIFI